MGRLRLAAFRVEARGQAKTLTPTALRGAVPIDPASEDFFKVTIEERQRLGQRSDLTADEQARLNKALKVFANATSYGIYGEMNREESDHNVIVRCHGLAF